MFIKKYRRIKCIHDLISIQLTGSAIHLAKRLQVSTITIYRDIQLIRSLGAVIQFNKQKKTFEYLTDFNLDLKKVEELCS
jgi:predicted DNA-binding transcriptional regulator YafY